DAYHGDPCPAPSLNNSLIKHLLDCPRLAWWNHPRLNPAYSPEPAGRALDLGSVAHKLLFGAGRDIQLIEAADYRTTAARELRDAARAAGRIPVLTEQIKTAADMAGAAKDQLACFRGMESIAGLRVKNVLDNGRKEIGLFWRDESGA